MGASAIFVGKYVIVVGHAIQSFQTTLPDYLHLAHYF